MFFAYFLAPTWINSKIVPIHLLEHYNFPNLQGGAFPWQQPTAAHEEMRLRALMASSLYSSSIRDTLFVFSFFAHIDWSAWHEAGV